MHYRLGIRIMRIRQCAVCTVVHHMVPRTVAEEHLSADKLREFKFPLKPSNQHSFNSTEWCVLLLVLCTPINSAVSSFVFFLYRVRCCTSCRSRLQESNFVGGGQSYHFVIVHANSSFCNILVCGSMGNTLYDSLVLMFFYACIEICVRRTTPRREYNPRPTYRTVYC